MYNSLNIANIRYFYIYEPRDAPVGKIRNVTKVKKANSINYTFFFVSYIDQPYLCIFLDKGKIFIPKLMCTITYLIFWASMDCFKGDYSKLN